LTTNFSDVTMAFDSTNDAMLKTSK